MLTRSLVRAGLVVLSLPLAASIASCAQRDADPGEASLAPDTREVPPGDFTLSITVYAPLRAARVGPAHRKPARYIIEADDKLRAAVGPGCTENTFPPPVRQLTQEQTGRVWRLTRDAGLLAPSPSRRIHSPMTYTPPSKGTVAVIAVHSDGRTVSSAHEGADLPKALLEELATLSWNAK